MKRACFSGWLLLLVGFAAGLASCTQATSPESDPKKSNGNQSIHVVTTTGMLADAVRNIAGSAATVEALMGPGVDPHGYTVSQGDVTKLREADLIVYNGIHLEGKMVDVLENLSKSKPVLALGEGLDPSKLRLVGTGTSTHDPHVWFDVPLWSSGVRALALQMGEKFPQHRNLFTQNAEVYLAQLSQLDLELRTIYDAIPPENRILVTSHDAFEYFGAAYGFEVMGLQGVSTVAEFGLRDMTNMVNLLTERKIPAVFVESSVPPRSIQSVVEGCRQKGHPLVIGGELYSDAMGPEGTPDGTYAGMLLHNARLISKALGGETKFEQP